MMNNLRNPTIFSRLLLPVVLSFLCYHSHGSASTFEDYEKALTAYNDKDYQTAFVHLKNSLQQDPNNLTAKILMGRLLLQNGYVRAAELEFRESIEMGADINLVAVPLGTSWLFMNHYHDVLDFTDYNRLSSEQKSAWLQIRATACNKLENETCAKEAYEQMLALPFHRDAAYTGLAAIAMRNNDLDSAEELLNQSKAINENSATLWRLIAQLSYRKGDVDTAIGYFKQALSLNSDDPIALRNLVNLYIAREDFASARGYIDEIMSRTPDDPLAILLNNWLLTQEETVTTNTAEIQKLGNTLSELSPDVVESQPLLIYISGLTSYFNGNIEKSVIDFERYLTKKPEDLQAIKLLAKAYISTQRPKLALSLLEQKQSILMQDLNAALLLGDLLINQNKGFRANNLIRTLEARYPNSLQLQLFKIKLMTIRGQEKQALSLLDSLYNSQQLNPTFLFTYASMKMRYREFEDAHKAVDGLIGIFPQKSDVYNLKASLFIQQKEYTLAREMLTKALSLNKNSFAARFNLASIDAKTGDIQGANARLDELLAQVPRHVPSQLLKAQNLIILNEVDSAVKIYKNVLALNPENQEARIKLVQISARKGDLTGALYQLDKLLKDDFDNPAFVLQKADILVSLERELEAEKALVLVKDSIQDNPVMLERYANVLIRLERFEEALTSLNKARTLSPNDNDLLLHTTKLQIALGRVTEAAETIATRIDKNQDNPNFWYVAGLLAEKKANYEKATQAYSRSLSLSPRFAQPLLAAYKMADRDNNPSGFIAIARRLMKEEPEYLLPANLLAQYFYYKQDFTKAIPVYSQLADHPQVLNKSKVLNRLAEMVAQTDTAQAAKWIAEAYKINAYDPEILDTYGWVLAQEGKYQESLEMLRRAFSRQATNPKLRFHLGFTLAKMGREEEAKEHLEIAANSEQDFNGKTQAETLFSSF